MNRPGPQAPSTSAHPEEGGSRRGGLLLNLAIAFLATVVAVEGGGRLLLAVARSWGGTRAASLYDAKLYQDLIAPSTKIRYDYDMFLGWRAQPNQRGRTYALNSSGRRDSVDYGPITRPAIFLTGGSAAWSVGASDNAHTLGACLERHLNARQAGHLPVKVYNFAEQAYGLRQETLTIIDALHLGVPDVVIFFDGVNDAHTVFLGRDPEHFRTYTNFGEILRHALEEYTADRLVGVRTILDNSMFWGVGRKSLALLSGTPAPRELTEGEAERIHGFFREQLRGLHQLLTRQGIHPVFVLQPIRFLNKHPSEGEGFLLEDRLGYAQWWRQAFAVLERAYAEARSEDGVHTVSLSDVLSDEQRQVFIDYAHLNDLGNDLVAQALASALDTAR